MNRKIPSDKAFGADNQQERLGMAYWIVGFTDGEGCFSVSAIHNSTTKFGKQLFPEFVITQGAKSINALRAINKFFGCGTIVRNKRYDNHNEDLYRYCVRAIPDLQTKIVPFFERFRLQTNKVNDFVIFRKIVKLMSYKKHLTKNGWVKIMKLASNMNRKKKRS